MPTAVYGFSLAAAGVSINKTVPRSSDGPIGLETSLTYGKILTSWVKTDANTAAGNLPGGHGYSNGNFDVFWTAGGLYYCRYGVPGTISTNALSLDGGAGDDFPASATDNVYVFPQTTGNLIIDGDNLKILGVVAEATDPNSVAQASIMFLDAAGDTIAQVDLMANVPQVWDVAGGSANPFSGDVITQVKLGNGSAASESLTIKIVGMQDATP